MKQAINIRLEKDVVQTLDEYALEEVFKKAGINVQYCIWQRCRKRKQLISNLRY